MIAGFALISWGQGLLPGAAGQDLRQCLYHSGETFFTLGYGDVTPASYTGKLLAVVEAGTGFGFMAIVIGYLPVLYQAFSRREQNIALLDARITGLVLSTIHHRDQARMYAKLVRDGRGELELSPEEAEAVRQAVGASSPSAS